MFGHAYVCFERLRPGAYCVDLAPVFRRVVEGYSAMSFAREQTVGVWWGETTFDFRRRRVCPAVGGDEVR